MALRVYSDVINCSVWAEFCHVKIHILYVTVFKDCVLRVCIWLNEISKWVSNVICH